MSRPPTAAQKTSRLAELTDEIANQDATLAALNSDKTDLQAALAGSSEPLTTKLNDAIAKIDKRITRLTNRKTNTEAQKTTLEGTSTKEENEYTEIELCVNKYGISIE